MRRAAAARHQHFAKAADELHVVFTQFRSMLVQDPHTVRMLPLEVVEGEAKPEGDEVLPLYEFEPSPQSVLDELLGSAGHVSGLPRRWC